MVRADEQIAAGDERLRASDLAGAERCYRLALEADPRSASAMQSIGFVCSQRGDHQAVLTWAQRAIEADPGYAPGHNLLGGVLLSLKRYEEALAALAKSPMDRRRDRVQVQFQMALCQAGLGRWPEAERDLRTALEDDPTYATRFAAVGMITHEPLYADCHHLLAHVLQRQGKTEEALLHGRLARRMDPTVTLTPLAKEILDGNQTDSCP